MFAEGDENMDGKINFPQYFRSMRDEGKGQAGNGGGGFSFGSLFGNK